MVPPSVQVRGAVGVSGDSADVLGSYGERQRVGEGNRGKGKGDKGDSERCYSVVEALEGFEV